MVVSGVTRCRGSEHVALRSGPLPLFFVRQQPRLGRSPFSRYLLLASLQWGHTGETPFPQNFVWYSTFLSTDQKKDLDETFRS